ncbi:hypothetical protein H0H93_003526 [Arthromyces matolae]|nr:hypothetical protein H0H93_003526 [Arthromyces matolae]
MSELPLDLRRTRSTSDIPRQAQSGRRPRHSLSPSDSADRHHSQRSAIPPYNHRLNHLHAQIRVESGQRSPQPASPRPQPQPEGLQHIGQPDQNDNDANPAPTNEGEQSRSTYQKLLHSLGYGRGASRQRRSLVGLILNLISGSSQIIIVTTILALSGTRFKSPTDPTLTEWNACSRPLGPWACLWVIRAVLATSLNYWGFLRERHLLARRRSELADSGPEETRRRQSGRSTGSDATRNPRTPENAEFSARDQAMLPYTLLYSRWFLTAHILAYTSINTCGKSSPHIWWLLFWNIVLICMGRHPLQTHNTIKPEIGKLPKSIVDTIPLVLYIPPPPESVPRQEQKPTGVRKQDDPPTVLSSNEPKQRFQFMKQFRSFSNLKTGSGPKSAEEKDIEKGEEPKTWEEHFEQGEYPFVVLEENRAACAICLLDFAEPKRIWGDVADSKAEASSDHLSENVAAAAPGSAGQPVSNSIAEVSRQTGHTNTKSKLVDAGEGTQPLRLLACGHVFHVSLTLTVSICVSPVVTDCSIDLRKHVLIRGCSIFPVDVQFASVLLRCPRVINRERGDKETGSNLATSSLKSPLIGGLLFSCKHCSISSCIGFMVFPSFVDMIFFGNDTAQPYAWKTKLV